MFIEESIGESTLRVIFFCITGIAGLIVVTIQIITRDVTTGTIYILMTRQTVPVGKMFKNFILFRQQKYEMNIVKIFIVLTLSKNQINNTSV